MRGADHGLGHEGDDVSGAEALELGLQFAREAVDVLGIGLVVALQAVGEAGRDEAECVATASARRARGASCCRRRTSAPSVLPW